jgi:hypothetical protein
MVRDFKEMLNDGNDDPFFKEYKPGRKPIDHMGEVEETVIGLRKKYFSVPDIQIALDALGMGLSIYSIERILKEAGFARLPRRDRQFRDETITSHVPELTAPKSEMACLGEDAFSSQLAGLLCIMPIIASFGIDKAIINSPYPETKGINKLSSILSFVALKLSNVKRYSADDTWCMDRGMGLFAGLNVLPKTAWFSSYSNRVTREMNVSFLKSLHSVWVANGLISDTANLDFSAIPYWGDDEPFENNWSGKRNKALASIQAVLAQDPESGILCYGDTTVRHDGQDDAILEFLDFYHSAGQKNCRLKYLVFDSKFTTYQNLDKLNAKGIKFITIRRRGKTIVEHINSIKNEDWRKVVIKKANGKSRAVAVCEEYGPVKGYKGDIRQIFMKSKGRQQPAILITNDFDLPVKELVRKYSRRWLIEKEISEQVDFFHLNRNSSGIVVKADFDLTMTILAHNLYRLFCQGLQGYSHCEAQTIFDKFIFAPGQIIIEDGFISVKLKKKRTLPVLLELTNDFKDIRYPWLGNFQVLFSADSTT